MAQIGFICGYFLDRKILFCALQQWDGQQWTVLTDWIATDQALVRPLVEASAAKYAQEKGITPRACP